MSDTPTQPANYTPSPIEKLTSHSIEQQMLAVLLRIEALLRGDAKAPQVSPQPQQDQSPPNKGKGGRFGRK